jgi:predicted phage terminase large subunit-like protein
LTRSLDFEDLDFAGRLHLKVKSEKSFLNFTRIWFELLQGEKLLVNWHHRWIAREVDSVVRGGNHSTNLAISIPPGGTKTEFMSIHLPAYTNMLVHIGEINRFRNMNLSFADSLVQRNSRRTRDIIKSKEFQELWPCGFGVDKADEWEIVNSRGKVVGQTVSRAMGGQITGGRGGFYGDEFSGAVNLDDPDKPEDMFSHTKRTAQHRKLVNTVRSRRGDKSKEHPTPFFVIQQRLHIEDTIGFCLAGKLGVQFKSIKIPALITEDYIETLPVDVQAECWESIKDSDCRLLNGQKCWSYWPKMEHIDQLIELMAQDDYTFQSQYQQNPTKMSGGLVDTAMFGRYVQLPFLQWMAVYVDTNSGKVKDRNDFTVFTLCAMGSDDNLYVLDIVRGKWTPSELQATAEKMWTEWSCMAPATQQLTLRYMKVEDKQAGQGLIADLQLKNKIPVVPVQRGENQNKFIRHNNCEPRIKMGRVFVPAIHDENGDKIPNTTFFDGTYCRGNDWVTPFLSECDAVTVGVLMDTESGYDDQYDTLMDAIDDMLVSNNEITVIRRSR